MAGAGHVGGTGAVVAAGSKVLLACWPGARPGLQFLVCTSRHHGFESLEERSLLVALDFVGVADVLPQPFRLDFEHRDGRGQHTPDFLAVLPDGGLWLFDARPGHLIKEADDLKFAATREVAAASGWRYGVVTGWRPHVLSVLDHLSSQRRPLTDPLGLRSPVEAGVGPGTVAFGALAGATRYPVVARAVITHMLWHRQLGVDLGTPLGDNSPVWRASGRGGR